MYFILILLNLYYLTLDDYLFTLCSNYMDWSNNPAIK